jgi:protein TonB
MKKFIVSIFASAFALYAVAQETVEKKVTDPHRPGVQEVFTVLKSSKKTKHGPYKKLNAQGKILSAGNFKDNKKDGTWEEFNYNGRLLSRGNYLNNEKTGVWEYYGYNDGEEQKYDHSKKELVSFKTKTGDSSYLVYKGNEIVQTNLDQPPLLIGGSPVIQQTLLQNLRYPAEAIRTQKTGTVIIAFDIDVDGNPVNYRVEEKVFAPLDAEALRVIKLLPRQWIPGIKDGQKVKVVVKQPVVFRLG